jgi:hypothetical protein
MKRVMPTNGNNTGNGYRGWAFDSGDDGGGTKDTPAGATTGERGMIIIKPNGHHQH